MSNCCIPGCSYTRKTKGITKRSLFTIRNPGFTRSNKEKDHRTALTAFILSLRDSSKGDRIKELLHKEVAQICEVHFKAEDILQRGSRKELRCGALPTHHLPKKDLKEKKSRAPPKERPPLLPKVYHRSSNEVQRSFNKLSKQKRSFWSILWKKGSLFLEYYAVEDEVTPTISVCVDENCNLTLVAYSGWRVNASDFSFNTLRTSTLAAFLESFEQFKLCGGVAIATASTNVHHLQRWDEDRLQCRTITRSPKCKCIVSVDGPSNCCACHAYEVKTKYNKQYYETSRRAEDCDSIAVEESFHEDIIKLFDKNQDGMNDWMKMFFKNQCDLASSSLNSRRYHPDVIRWAIELYARSPAAYDQLRTSGVLILPSCRTLRSFRNALHSQPGVNPLAIAEIESLPAAVDGYVTVDEMKIKENLVLKDGKLVGFVDFDGRETEEKLATHVCMFYARSFKKEISIPISWWPTTATAPHILASLFWEVVAVCERRKFHIHAVVADGSATNRKFFNIIHGSPFTLSAPRSYTCPNPYRKTMPIFICSDTSHLLKTARNALYSSKPSGTKYLHLNGSDILWTHILQLRDVERTSQLHKTRLTNTHVELNSYSKMHVSLARDTFSWEVSTALRQDVAESEGTADYILHMNRWFEIVTCGVRNPIRSCDDERLHWLEKDFVEYFVKWRNEVDTCHKGEEKRIIAKPTLEGLIFTSINLASLTRRMLRVGMRYVCLRTITQDVLEALFGNLRSLGHRCSNPDVKAVSYGVTAISHRKIIKQIKGGSTTFGQKNPWTNVSEKPILK